MILHREMLATNSNSISVLFIRSYISIISYVTSIKSHSYDSINIEDVMILMITIVTNML